MTRGPFRNRLAINMGDFNRGAVRARTINLPARTPSAPRVIVVDVIGALK